MFNAFRWITTSLRRRTQVRTPRAARPILEVLEDRLAPAVLVVNSSGDNVTPDAFLTLREAIAAVNTGSANGLTASEQGQITGQFGQNDRIELRLPTGSVELTMGELVLNRGVEIDGLAKFINRSSSAPNARLFTIMPDVFVQMSRLTLSGGKVDSLSGGAIRNRGTLVLDSVTIDSNQAQTGGAIANSATLIVQNSTISNNTAFVDVGTALGGGIDNDGTLTVVNSTFFGNKAITALALPGALGKGGAISNSQGTACIINSTIVGNEANIGGGIFTADPLNPTTRLFNSILVANRILNSPVLDDIVGPVESTSRNNLVSQTGAVPAGLVNGHNILAAVTPFNPADQIEMALTIQKTLALKPGSLAIDAGSNAHATTPGNDGIPGTGTNDDNETPLVFEQRKGVFRRVGASVDIGAVEFIPTELVVDSLSDTVDGNGTPGNLSLREALQLVNNGLGGNHTITITAQGTINLSSELVIFNLTGTTTVRGPGVSNLTIDAGARSRIFNILTSSSLSGITMQNGRADKGGGIQTTLNGSLILTNSTVRDCVAQADGGGIDAGGSLTLNNVTIQNCRSEGAEGKGGGVFASTSVTVNNSTFVENFVNSQGGGVFATDVTVNNSTFIDNGAVSHGGGLFANGIVAINNSTFFRNSSLVGGGGGVFVDSDRGFSSVVSSTFVRNSSKVDFASAIHARLPSRLSLSNSIFIRNPLTVGLVVQPLLSQDTRNLKDADPQAIFVTDGNGNPLLADNGGPTRTLALRPDSSNPALNQGAATGTDQRGFLRGSRSSIGAFELSSSPIIQVTTLLDEDDGSATPNLGTGTSLREALALANSVAFSSSIQFKPGLTGTLTLTRGELQLTNAQRVTVEGPGFGNIVLNGGGQNRIFHVLDNAVATILGLTLTNGRAPISSGGGGVRAAPNANVELVDLDIHGNSADDGAGGVANLGTMRIERVTVRDNVSNFAGGGIGNAGTLTVVNSTIANNRATERLGFGGGIDSVGTLTVVNSTIAGNQSNLGGGILTDEFEPNVSTILVNTLVIGNSATTGADLGGKAIEATSSNNIIGETLSSVLQTNAGVPVVTFANGGKTPTIALVANSPALNAGDNNRATPNGQSGFSLLGTDQRGLARIVSGTVDIGAVEAALTLSFPTISKSATPKVRVSAGPGVADGTSVAIDVDLNNDGDFNDANETGFASGTLTSGAVTVTLPALTNGTKRVQARLGALVSPVATLTVITSAAANVLPVTPQTIQAVIANLASAGDTLLLGPGSYAGITINQGMTLDGQGGSVVFRGASPALTVTAGIVEVKNRVNFVNDTDAPSIVVQNGAQVKLRNSTIQESAGFEQAAIRVEAGGRLDLGTSAEPGGNSIFVRGAGSFLDDRGATALAVEGNAWFQDDLRIPDVLQVDTTGDENDGNIAPGNLSLREAVALANRVPGAQEIVFLSGLGDIILTQSELVLTDTTGLTTISGPQDGLQTIDRQSPLAFRIFQVASNVRAAFNQLSIENGIGDNQGGGGILNAGNLTVVNSHLTFNGQVDGDGGGIRNTGTLTLIGSTLSFNVTGQRGAGLANEGTATLINSTFAFNNSNAAGGGLFANSGSTTLLTNVTVALNASDADGNGTGEGGGIDINGGSVTLNNTIVAGNEKGAFGNRAPSDIGDGFVNRPESFNNLIGDNGTGGGVAHGVNGNKVGNNGSGTLPITTILETQLANNGGPTPTLALTPNSPARNAGRDDRAVDAQGNPLLFDQRGAARLVGTVDIGAFEALLLHFNNPEGFNLGEVLRGQTLLGVLAQFVPAPGDGPEDFTILINWGDGKVDSKGVFFSYSGGAIGFQGDHIYDFEGSYTISMTIAHTDGATAEFTSSATATVTSLDPVTRELLIGGTPNRETIGIEPTGPAGSNVLVRINGTVVGEFPVGGSIGAFGYGGDDTLTVSKLKVGSKVFKVKAQTLLHGGAGNDILDAKSIGANTILIGGAGNDTLTGGGLRDVMIGGLGSDILKGGGGDNILIGDRYNREDDFVLARLLQNVWAIPTLKFKQRVAELTNDTFNQVTLEADEAVDQLFGGAAKDWFLRRQLSQDVVKNKLTGDIDTVV